MAQPEQRDEAPGPQHLDPTAFVDAEHPSVEAFAERAVAEAATDHERISRLFTAVRDEIRFDPYRLSHDPRDSERTTAVRGSRSPHAERMKKVRGRSGPRSEMLLAKAGAGLQRDTPPDHA